MLRSLGSASVHPTSQFVPFFVNPTQFNDPKDLEKYPRTVEADSKILIDLETEILYLPTKQEVYPKDINTEVKVEFGNLFNVMEGHTVLAILMAWFKW